MKMVKSGKIKERQHAKISIPLGMLRSVENVQSLSPHSVRNASNTIKQYSLTGIIPFI